MHDYRTASSLTLALLTATFLTPPELARAAPGDALGPEFQVNTFTTGGQEEPALAMDADGDFVVAWQSRGQDDPSDTSYHGYGIFAQRFDAAGVPQGPEFQVNSFTTGGQEEPAVAMDADGDFVVAWQSRDQDGDAYGVFAQRFDAAGVAQGVEFHVNSFTTGYQYDPAVAMDADGDFVVVWSGRGLGDAIGVFAQRFNAAGVAQGSEFQVSSFTTDNQNLPAVAMDSDGDFVVAWQYEPISYEAIFARRFDAAGVAQGPEFQVNTFTASLTTLKGPPAVAVDADGDFVVAWHDYGDLGGSGYVVFARRFDAAGVAQGPEFQANSATGYQNDPAVAMDADGDFVVAWVSDGQDGSSYGVFAQRFDAAGVAQGPEFQVNSFTTSRQDFPAVAMDADGDFVVAWESRYQDGDADGTFAQRYDGVERIAADFDGDGNADVLWRRSDNGNTSLWLMDGITRLAAAPLGNPGTVWVVAGTGDFNGDAKADVLWRRSDNGNMSLWLMDGATRIDAGPLGNPGTAWQIEALRDTNGDGLSDIVWRHTGNDKTAVWQMSGFTRVDAAEVGTAGAAWQVQ